MQEKPERLPNSPAKLQDLNWDDLRVLLALGRAGSFAAAARRLGVNETTVLRRLERLSTRLGARLFERSGGSLVPTDAGDRLLRDLEQAEAAIERGAAAARGQDSAVAGLLRLTAVPLLANRLLVPALPGLLRRHPGLEVELIAEPSALSVMRREVDIALRLARPQQDPTAITRRVGRLAYAPFVARGRATEDLPWITYGQAMAELPQARWVAERSVKTGEPILGLKVNDGEALLQAVRAGLGKALLPTGLLAGEPEIVAAGPPCLRREVWTMVHPALRDLARVRCALDWIAETLAGAPKTA